MVVAADGHQQQDSSLGNGQTHGTSAGYALIDCCSD